MIENDRETGAETEAETGAVRLGRNGSLGGQTFFLSHFTQQHSSLIRHLGPTEC